MVVSQRVKKAKITEQDLLLQTRILLQTAVFNISYKRGIFPEKYFNDKSVPALEMKIKKLMPLDAGSHRLIDWREKGEYDALQTNNLRTLLFCLCEAIGHPIIEEYAFSFSNLNADGQEVVMNINRTVSNKQGGTFKCNSTEEVASKQMKSFACKIIRIPFQFMKILEKVPEEVASQQSNRNDTEEIPDVLAKPDISLVLTEAIMDKLTLKGLSAAAGKDTHAVNKEKLFDYEPPFFRGGTAEDEHQGSHVKDRIRFYCLDTEEISDVLANYPDITLCGDHIGDGDGNYDADDMVVDDVDDMVDDDMDDDDVDDMEDDEEVDEEEYDAHVSEGSEDDGDEKLKLSYSFVGPPIIVERLVLESSDIPQELWENARFDTIGSIRREDIQSFDDLQPAVERVVDEFALNRIFHKIIHYYSYTTYDGGSYVDEHGIKIHPERVDMIHQGYEDSYFC